MGAQLTDKERQIAQAALRAFTRYGLKRTTMNDIAEEAGVVRQTLYNVFANKDEVIHGTVLFYTDLLRQQTRTAWKDARDLGDKIDILFAHNVLAPWDTVRASPDAGDLDSSDHACTKRAVEIAGQEMRGLLEDLFAPYSDALARCGQTPALFAAFVEATMTGLKHDQSDRAALVQLLASLKALILMACT